MSLNEASRILKTPETTLRRMAVEGKITAEREPRGAGDTRTVWRIRIDDPPDEPPPSANSEEDDIRHDVSTAVQGILEALSSERERSDRLIVENADLRERVGRAEAEAAMLQARLDDVSGRLWQAEAREAERPWWRKLWR